MIKMCLTALLYHTSNNAQGIRKLEKIQEYIANAFTEDTNTKQKPEGKNKKKDKGVKERSRS